MDQVKTIIISFVFVFLFINIVINKKLINLIFDKKITVKKFEVKVLTIVKIILIIGVLAIILFYAKNIFEIIKIMSIDTGETDKIIIDSKNRIQEDNEIYKKLINKEYNIQNSKNPYIFKGFKYVEGEWNTGFVIEDENKNQFVWVPCTNVSNEEKIEILEKTDFVVNPFIISFDCYNPECEIFLKSALENGGFYVSRYEIGNENGIAVSKSNVNPYTSVTQVEALEISKNMYDEINSSLINGYAYDTMYNWIIHSENFKMNDQKNINGIFNKIYEFTSEIYYTGIIYRGIIFENEYIDTGNLDNRLNSSNDYSDEYIGFRTILYK